jgi:catechol 2,3-dioxygenase-like lactoylglutathione lyase family enzyme
MAHKIISSSPVLLVKDVVKSAEWYKDKCGFQINNCYGEPVSFAIINRDGYYLMFAKCEAEKIVPNWKLVDKTPNAYFWVDDVEAIYKEFISNGSTIDYELCIQPYGVKEFGINDPDGYDVSFGEIIREA